MTAARRAGLACVVAAALNLVAWSLLTPPFHVPDEVGHMAYVQQLAEAGRPPDPDRATELSAQERAALSGLFFYAVAGQPRNSPPDVPGEQAALLRGLAENPGNRAGGSAGAATLQPPLYFALQSVPYAAGAGRGILTRLTLMRLLSCLLGVVTVACCFGFLREALPGAPWAWAVGALVAAFQPLFAFVSSGVDADALLFAAAAGLFWALARAFRLGLTRRRGAAIGATLAVGSVGHLLFLGLVPGALLAIAVLARRGRREGRAADDVRAAVLLALGVWLAPLLLDVVLNAVAWDRPALGLTGLGVTPRPPPGLAGHATLPGLLSYGWQLYAPRLPFMHGDLVPGFGPWHLWFSGLMGRLGWSDYGVAGWVEVIGAFVAVLVLAGAASAVVRGWGELRRRGQEAGAYVAMALGLLLLLAWVGYRAAVARHAGWVQARDVLPLLALYAAVAALAVRAGGPRWGPPLGAGLVVLAAGHDVIAGLTTLARFYG
jgi:hypothetical protein